jgi:hypothetical protein
MRLARLKDASNDNRTGTEQVMRTVDYMCPEQAARVFPLNVMSSCCYPTSGVPEPIAGRQAAAVGPANPHGRHYQFLTIKKLYIASCRRYNSAAHGDSRVRRCVLLKSRTATRSSQITFVSVLWRGQSVWPAELCESAGADPRVLSVY